MALDREAVFPGPDEDVVAGVFSVLEVVVVGFLSPEVADLLLESLRVRLSIGPVPVPAPAPVFFERSCDPTRPVWESVVSFSLILSSLISPGIGNGSATLFVEDKGVEGVAGVRTNSGGD